MSINAIVAFNSGIDQLKQNAATARDIQAKNEERDQQRESFGLQKEMYKLKIKQAIDEGKATDFEAKNQQAMMNTLFDNKEKELDLTDSAANMATKKIEGQSQQIKQGLIQLHQQDPDVQNHFSQLMGAINGKMGMSPQVQQQNVMPQQTPQQSMQQPDQQQTQESQIPEIMKQPNQQPIQQSPWQVANQRTENMLGKGWALNPNRAFDKKAPQFIYHAEKADPATVFQGIDTVNSSPEQIGQELKAKNPGHYNFLKSIEEGRYKVTGRSSKEMNAVIEQIQTIWPGADIQALQARYDTRKDFTSGKTANNITALNTALSHLDKLSNNADSLDNGAFRYGNKLGNILKTQTGNSKVRVLNSDIRAVSGELSTTFKQSGATDSEIRNFQESLDAADSKKVVKDVVNEFIGLIGGRTQPLVERWQNAFGNESTFPVVGNHGQAVLKKHGFDWNPQTGEIISNGSNQPDQPNDAFIQNAKSHGYSDEEIQAYLKGKQ